jgi:hypothetical protein
MATTLSLFRVVDSIVGPMGCFAAGAILGVKPGDALPEGLRHVVERLPDYVAPTADTIVIDPAQFVARKERPEAVPAAPLTEPAVRKLCRLQDPALWSVAQTLNFPAASLRRHQRAPLPMLGTIEVKLWQPAEVAYWLERFRQLVPAIGRG